MLKNHVKIVISSIIVTLLSIILINTTTYMTAYANDNSTPVKTMQSIVNAVNSKNWDEYIKNNPASSQESDKLFFGDQENHDNHVGILAVNSAELKLMKKIDKEICSQFMYTRDYPELLEHEDKDIEAYLVGLDCDVDRDKESKYFYNGVNYSLDFFVKEEDGWKLSQDCNAPLEILEYFKDNQALKNNRKQFDSINVEFIDENMSTQAINDTLLTAISINKARLKGEIINADGEIIEINRASKEQLDEEKGISTENDKQKKELDLKEDLEMRLNSSTERPDYIKVKINDTGKIKKVDFYSYCKNVLPNEWISGWHKNALRAGAMCVKMVGWWHYYHPVNRASGYDVSTGTQAYKAGTEVKRTTDAINYVSGVGMYNSNRKIFFPAYRKGENTSSYPERCGKVSQYGTWKLAKAGKTYRAILNYYYSYSDKSPKSIRYFSY